MWSVTEFNDLPGTALYSTKSNITTPTTTQDNRAARAISSSTDTFTFLRRPRPLDLREVVCGATAPFDPSAEEGAADVSAMCGKHKVTLSISPLNQKGFFYINLTGTVKIIGIISPVLTIYFNTTQQSCLAEPIGKYSFYNGIQMPNTCRN